MSEKHPQPRWWLLYLTLPLAGGLFWLIQRLHPSASARDLLMLGALLIVGGYAEVWRLVNTAALLHHPLPGNDGQPIYYAREVAGSNPARVGSGIQAVLVAGAYDDLFSIPVYIGEPSPAVAELPDGEESPHKSGSTPAPGRIVAGCEDVGSS